MEREKEEGGRAGGRELENIQKKGTKKRFWLSLERTAAPAAQEDDSDPARQSAGFATIT